MSEMDASEVEQALDEFLGYRDDSTSPRMRKRRRIVEAATELFTRHGYRKASVDEIARQAGVAKGTVYLYFRTKADLLVHAVAAEKRRYVHQVLPILHGDLPPRERLRQWLNAMLTTTIQMPLVGRLVSGDREINLAVAEMSPDLWEKTLQIRADFIVRLLADAALPMEWPEAELRDRARTLIGVLYSSLVADERTRGGLSRERYGQVLADLLLDGAVPKRALSEAGA